LITPNDLYCYSGVVMVRPRRNDAWLLLEACFAVAPEGHQRFADGRRRRAIRPAVARRAGSGEIGDDGVVIGRGAHVDDVGRREPPGQPR
jgi:hypothetical protein